MKLIIVLIIVSSSFQCIAQLNRIEEQNCNNTDNFSITNLKSKTPCDTIMLYEFNNLSGYAAVLPYNYTNGNGHFFGTNWLDLDQDPNTPRENGIPACAQGFSMDSVNPYYIEEILIRVGYKYKTSTNGTPLILSVQKLDGISDYTVNTQTGPIQHTISCPGTTISSTSIPWDSIKSGYGVKYSVAKLPMPVLINSDYCVVVDFLDFYFNGDKVGLYCSPNGGASNIYGKDKTLWHYPNPFMWLQVDHIYNSIDRAIAIFPVIDDGTAGIENDNFNHGIKLGQNYPNPSTDKTQIDYELEKDENITFELIDSNGKSIKLLNEGKKPKGKHSININTSEVSKGIYYYSLKTDSKCLTKKLIIK